MAKLALTDRAIRELPVPESGNEITYDVPAGNKNYVRGFAVRVTAAGTRTFLLCYVTAEGRERRQKIGDLGPFTISTAREAARQLRARVARGEDPMAAERAVRAAGEARRPRERITFEGLLTAYCDALDRARKPSGPAVRREIRRTIELAAPQVWKRPVDDVTISDLVGVIHKLMKAEKWRQAEKTRSYIAAAYTMAAASKGDAGIADLFADYANVPNVGRDIAAIRRPKLADDHEGSKRALTQPELASYWTRIMGMEGPAGALLRFHLLSGAQRCAQLARLTSRHVADGVVTLMDSKGRRAQARKHVVPLLPEAEEALVVMRGEAGPYVFSLDAGKTGADFHSVRRKVQEVAQAMVDAKEVTDLFTPGELRVTVETRLAAAGIPMEYRAQLQSHGLGGVQFKHYDKHHYLDEKLAALNTLRALLEPKPQNVTPIKRRTA